MAISVSEIYLEQQKTEKIFLDFEDGERKGWTIFERIDNSETGAGIICRLSNRRRHDVVSGVLPEGGEIIPPGKTAMNKQSTLEQDRKRRRSRPKLHNLPPKKNLKGGSSAQSLASQNGSSGIPTSLQEFLKRDSLPIKSA
jgi:hypothetical protein